MNLCKECELNATSKKQWFPKVNTQAKICIVLPYPNHAKDDVEKISSWILQIGANPKDFFITSLLKCPKPQKLKTDSEFYEVCLNTNFMEELSKLPNCKSLILMGAPTCEAFMGEKLNSVAGKIQNVNGYSVIATYQPSALAYSSIIGEEAVLNHIRVMYHTITENTRTRQIRTHLIETSVQLLELYENLQSKPEWAFDFETLGLEFGDTIIGVSFSWDRYEGYYLPLMEYVPILGWQDYQLKDEKDVDLAGFVSDVLETSNADKICQSAKFEESRAMYSWNCTVHIKHDTQIIHYLLNQHSKSHTLETISEEYYDFKDYKETIKKVDFSKRGWEVVPLAEIADYGAKDSILTYRYKIDNYDKMSEKLKSVGYKLLMESSSLIANMERQGIYIDANYINELGTTLIPLIQNSQEEFNAVAGKPINLGSPPQLKDFLYNILKLPTNGISKTKTGYSTDKTAIAHLIKTTNNEYLNKIITFRRATKAKSIYVDGLREALVEGCWYHPNWKLTRTSTGRLASGSDEDSEAKMNMQNIPVRDDIYKVKKLFAAPPGYDWYSTDYSQIEVRVMAEITQDPVLLDALAKDFDPHSFNASIMLGVMYEVFMSGYAEGNPLYKKARDNAKTIGFGWIYGAQTGKFAKQGLYALPGETYKTHLKIWIQREEEAKARYFDMFKTFLPWKQSQLELLWENHYVESSITGRIRKFPALNAKNLESWKKEAAEREAINTLIQGPASDFTLSAAVQLRKMFKAYELNARVVNLVHDAIYGYGATNQREEIMDAFKSAMLYPYFNFSVNMGIEMNVKSGWLGTEYETWKGSKATYTSKYRFVA